MAMMMGISSKGNTVPWRQVLMAVLILVLGFAVMPVVTEAAPLIPVETFSGGDPEGWSSNWTTNNSASPPVNGDIQTAGANAGSGSTGPTTVCGLSICEGGSFAFYEASSGASAANPRYLTAVSSFNADTYDITVDFAYNMYGAGMGTLNLQVDDSGNGSNWTTVWTRSGDQTDTWYSGENQPDLPVDLSSYTGTINIRFEMIYGTAYTSDMAIDSVTIDGVSACSDPDVATLTTTNPTSSSTVGGSVTIQTQVGVEGTPAGMTSMLVNITGSTGCNVTNGVMTWNGGSSRWEYSWNTSACGTSSPDTGVSIAVSGTDPDCGTAVNATTITNVTIDNSGPPTAITTCSDCHGQPPVDGTRNATTRATPGSHGPHVNSVGLACTGCHINNGTSASAYPQGLGHREGLIEMLASIDGGTYSKGASFAQASSPTMGTCNNVACHYSTAQTWGGASLGCTGCHGQPPAQGSHTAHFSTPWTSAVTWDCTTATCHVKPATNVTATHPDGTTQQSCSSTQCHNPTGFFTANAIGSNPNPIWGTGNADCGWCHDNPPTTSALYNHSGVTPGACSSCHGHDGSGANHLDGSYSPPVLACDSCHGYPPVTGGGANDKHVAPVAVDHGTKFGDGGATLLANHTDCQLCHGTRDNGSGQHDPHANYTVSTQHNTGNINMNSGTSYNQTNWGCDAACHANDTNHRLSDSGMTVTTGNYGAGGDCVACHSSAQGSRAAVVSEFGLAWGHKKSGRGAVTASDCIVCHLEGEYATQAQSATYHGDGNIDLRDPDGAGETRITNNSGASFTFAQYSVSYASGARTTTLGNTVAEVVTVKFCMACHDNNGATNTTARTTYGTPTAAMPFGGVALGSNYNSTNNAVGTQGLIDVKTQFSTSMTSRHPVGAPNTRAYPYSTRLPVPYNNIGTARNSNTQALGSGTRTTANSVVMVCDDCHTDSTTISSRVTNRTVTAHGASSSIAGTYFVDAPTLCLTCHIPLASDPTNQFYNNENTNGGRHGTGSGLGNASTTRPRTVMNYCNMCHFSQNTNYTAANRPRYAQDVHGFDSIYGTTSGWPAGNGSGMRPRAFMRSSQAGAGGGSWPTNVSPRPYSAPGITAGNATCGGSSNLNAGNSGGSCNDNHTTYSPGGAY